MSCTQILCLADWHLGPIIPTKHVGPTHRPHKGSTHQADRDPHVIHSEFMCSYWHLDPTVRPKQPDKRDRSSHRAEPDRGVPTVRPHRSDKQDRSTHRAKPDRGVPDSTPADLTEGPHKDRPIICGKIDAQGGGRTWNLPTRACLPYH
jgi:hypothetical protein